MGRLAAEGSRRLSELRAWPSPAPGSWPGSGRLGRGSTGWWSESGELVVACASAATPSATSAGRIASRSLITYVVDLLPISGRAQRLANRARRVRTQSRDRAVRHSWGALAAEQRARVIRHDAFAVFGEDPPLARLSTESVEHARAGGHRERAHIDHVGDIVIACPRR